MIRTHVADFDRNEQTLRFRDVSGFDHVFPDITANSQMEQDAE